MTNTVEIEARRARYEKHGLSPREIEALQIDEVLARVARSRGLYALAIGETLLQLFATGNAEALRLPKEADFARERLGVKPRAIKEWTRLAKGCRDRPLLRRAVAAGLVTPRKALAVFSVAKGDDEGAWTAAAIQLSLKDLTAAVRAEGGTVEEEYAGRARWLPLLEKGRQVVDIACQAMHLVEGGPVPRWAALEAMCMEWLGDERGRKKKGGSGGEERRKCVQPDRKRARGGSPSVDRFNAETQRPAEVAEERARTKGAREREPTTKDQERVTSSASADVCPLTVARPRRARSAPSAFLRASAVTQTRPWSRPVPRSCSSSSRRATPPGPRRIRVLSPVATGRPVHS